MDCEGESEGNMMVENKEWEKGKVKVDVCG